MILTKWYYVATFPPHFEKEGKPGYAQTNNVRHP
jgi:hypothetical protein